MTVTVTEIQECDKGELAAALDAIFDAGGNVIQILADPAHGKEGHASVWIVSEDSQSVALTVSGRDDAVPLTTWTDIWPGVGNIPDTEDAREFEIVSTSVLDTALGSGIRTVSLDMMRVDYSVARDLVVTMDGTTPVPIPGGPYMLCSTMRAATAGAGGRAVGDITVEDTPGGTIYNLIDTGATSDQQLFVVIPSGASFALLGWEIALATTNPNSALDSELQIRDPGGAWFAIDIAPQLDQTFRAYQAEMFAAAPAGTRFKVQAFSARAGELVTAKMNFGATG